MGGMQDQGWDKCVEEQLGVSTEAEHWWQGAEMGEGREGTGRRPVEKCAFHIAQAPCPWQPPSGQGVD